MSDHIAGLKLKERFGAEGDDRFREVAVVLEADTCIIAGGLQGQASVARTAQHGRPVVARPAVHERAPEHRPGPAGQGARDLDHGTPRFRD